jgi:hypothetical protein
VPVFGPIKTERSLRRFGVFDLEWVPGEVLPPLRQAEVQVDGIREPVNIPLPATKRMTDPLRLRMAGYYDKQIVDEEGDDPQLVENFQSFATVRELLDNILTREHRGQWFFAHAGGLADMQFVLDEILRQIKGSLALKTRTKVTYSPSGERIEEEVTDDNWQIKASFSGSSAIIVHVIKGKNAWHFCDSYWLLRDKLSSIGKAIGIKKGDSQEAKDWMSHRFGRTITDFEELTKSEKTIFYSEVPMEILVGYNKTDCEILWTAIAQFEEEIVGLGGQLQQTIASTAMSLFRRAFLTKDIFTSEKLNQISQESYFASRVEVFARNAEDFQIFDINSSFPYSMTFPLPGNLIGVQYHLPDDDSDACIYFADVTIEVPEMHLPPLPFRKDNRVFFPVGRWRSWFSSTDIRLALREGATVHKVHEVLTFEPFYDFAEYSKKIYDLRAKTKIPFRKLVLKYLLNSLYGKTAESTLKQEMLVNPKKIDRSSMQMLQPGIWLAEKEARIIHRHVPIASIITSIARRTLYDYMKIAINQGFPVYYTDTDSVSTKADLPVDDTKLGWLKLEKKMEWAEFVAPKIYRGEGFELDKDGTWKPKVLTKAKGFSLGVEKEAYEKLDRIVGGERLGVQRMTRLRELYRTTIAGQYTTAPFELLVIKALTFEMLSKRFHYPDGETRPWSVNELRSGDCYPKGYDFEKDIYSSIDSEVKKALRESVA